MIVASLLILLLAKHQPGIHVVDSVLVGDLRKNPRPVRSSFEEQFPAKDEILYLRYILIPFNEHNHWTLGVINLVRYRIEYYNSLVPREI
jgi:hypothetical protein